MSALPASGFAARAADARVRLQAVDRRDAALMSVGTLASGVLAYAFNVLAARSLGPESYGAIGALWAGMFLLAVLLFRPLEQTISRAVSHQLAHGIDARPAVRSAARLAVGVTVLSTAGCLAAWGPLTDGLFGGRPALTIALIVGLAGYAASYFARGVAGGVRWFGGYGLVLLADGAIRVLVALPLIFVASPTVAAVAIAAAASAGAIAPLCSRRRGALRRLGGVQGEGYSVRAAGRFALPAAVIAGCEQILISGGPLIVLISGGEGAAAAAGVLFAATLLVRAPVFLFQGVQASLLPNLTTFEAQGDQARLRRATALTAGAIAALAVILAAGALAVGPWTMGVLFGDGFAATRTDLALLALGVGGFLAACTFCQALLARGHGVTAAVRWSAAALLFIVLALTLDGSEFHRVSIAFAASGGLVALLLVSAVWRQRT
jgi:O-antigen/teichoic acid export membrane protein